MIYRYIPFYKSKRFIEETVGIDSEAYTTGKPFMFCTSYEECFTLSDIPNIFFTRRYRNKNFVVFNLQYDSGAILYNLPEDKKIELWQNTKCLYNGFRYFYIPHKHLRISKGKNAVKFWDIQPFYNTSLKKASVKYLNETKVDIETKSFTPEYAKENWSKIKKYCIQDAVLTVKLADYLFNYLQQFGIKPSSLYSIASVSFQYLSKRVRIRDVWNLWQYDREVLKYACDSYSGGKFEVTARGSFTGFEYDINSCYPYEIMNLYDIKHADYFKSNKYEKGAKYGFLKVYINNKKGLYHPISKKYGFVNVFPSGMFNATITKQEYEYLQDFGIDVKIKSAWWCKLNSYYFPYKNIVKYLYEIKQDSKYKNSMVSYVAKIMLNSIYGKFAQIIEQPDGKLICGIGWNPLYASIITANSRIRMSGGQIAYGDNCIAVHTDSVITTKPISSNLIGDDIGKMKLAEQGKGILIASGMYEIGKKAAWRGFEFGHVSSWQKILTGMQDRQKIAIRNVKPLTWIQALELKQADKINKFMNMPKYFNVNADTKRLWFEKTNAKRLLSGLERSIPHIMIEEEKRE